MDPSEWLHYHLPQFFFGGGGGGGGGFDLFVIILLPSPPAIMLAVTWGLSGLYTHVYTCAHSCIIT